MIRVINNHTKEILRLDEPTPLDFKRMFRYAMQFAIENAKHHNTSWVTLEVDGQPKCFLVPTLYKVGNSSPTSASIDLIRIGYKFSGPIKWISKL